MLLAALQFVEWSRSLGRKLRGFFSFYFLRVNGEQKKKKKGKAGGAAVRARTASNAELNREGGEGQREAALDRNPSSGGFRKGTFQQH